MVAFVVLVGCKKQIVEPALAQTGNPTTEPPAEESVPDIGLSECLNDVKATNPEMTDQQVNDNCQTVLAVNTGDASYCDKVSAGFKENCLAAILPI